jgi:hypothetical protein
MPETILSLGNIAFPVGSARNIKQTLEPINIVRRRTVNGDLRSVTPEQLKRWRVSVSCSDQNTPAIDDLLSLDDEIEVVPIQEWKFTTATGAPSRRIADGTDHDEDGITYYRPLLIMMITAFSSSADGEWTADQSWSITLEESSVLPIEEV